MEKIKIIFSFIIMINFLNIFIYNFRYKICLCTIGKQENKYILEYINYYKNFGVDKIFLYDNNEQNNEKFEEIIFDYINSGFVELINYRGKKEVQLEALNDCYKKNNKKYNWLIFYDIDEFLYLKNHNNIKNFLKEPKFNKCQIIQLNWVIHTDNNSLYYQNKSIIERFPEIGKSLNNSIDIKSIIRGNINIKITSTHYLSPKLIACDGFGNKKELNKYFSQKRDKQFYFINHYYTKSTEEFIEKIMKGSVWTGESRRFGIVQNYFEINRITKEKINFIEDKTGINLTKYKKILAIKNHNK